MGLIPRVRQNRAVVTPPGMTAASHSEASRHQALLMGSFRETFHHPNGSLNGHIEGNTKWNWYPRLGFRRHNAVAAAIGVMDVIAHGLQLSRRILHPSGLRLVKERDVIAVAISRTREQIAEHNGTKLPKSQCLTLGEVFAHVLEVAV